MRSRYGRMRTGPVRNLRNKLHRWNLRPNGCSPCFHCSRPARTGARSSSANGSMSPSGRCGATWPGSATSATRCWPSPDRMVATNSAPGDRCRRCCSPTTRRWPSRSGCGRRRRAAWPDSRTWPSPPWPSSNRCCRCGCGRRWPPSPRPPCWSERTAGPLVDSEALLLLAQASRGLERVTFRYRDGEGNESDRRVEPFRLVTASRRWYLVALDVDRDDWRTFRVDRMSEPLRTGHRFVRTSEPDAAQMVADGIAVHGYSVQAEVDLMVGLERAAEVIPATVGRLDAVDDATTRMRLGAPTSSGSPAIWPRCRSSSRCDRRPSSAPRCGPSAAATHATGQVRPVTRQEAAGSMSERTGRCRRAAGPAGSPSPARSVDQGRRDGRGGRGHVRPSRHRPGDRVPPALGPHAGGIGSVEVDREGAVRGTDDRPHARHAADAVRRSHRTGVARPRRGQPGHRRAGTQANRPDARAGGHHRRRCRLAAAGRGGDAAGAHRAGRGAGRGAVRRGARARHPDQVQPGQEVCGLHRRVDPGVVPPGARRPRRPGPAARLVDQQQHRWAPISSWLPGGLEDLPTPEAQVELVGRWLRVFGPATLGDIKWWTGWTMGETRRAVAGLDTVEVDLVGRDGGAVARGRAGRRRRTGRRRPKPWVALLPALDATPMGWTERDWYLGEHRAPLFDRSGNIGPTVWVDGRIVGGWGQRRSDGEIVFRLLEDVGSEAAAAIEAEADRLGAWLGGRAVHAEVPDPLAEGAGGRVRANSTQLASVGDAYCVENAAFYRLGRPASGLVQSQTPSGKICSRRALSAAVGSPGSVDARGDRPRHRLQLALEDATGERTRPPPAATTSRSGTAAVHAPAGAASSRTPDHTSSPAAIRLPAVSKQESTARRRLVVGHAPARVGLDVRHPLVDHGEGHRPSGRTRPSAGRR